MDLLKRERIQPDVSDGMNFRWVMNNRRNTRIGRSAGRASGRTAEISRRQRVVKATPVEEGSDGRPWKGVRPAEVTKAKRLVRDRGYPSRQVMESVAALLADHMTTPGR